MRVVLALNLALVTALVAVGVVGHSLGVLAEGGDYLADAAAIGVSLLAIRLSNRPGGMPKATAMAALINGGWLAILSTLVVFAALVRLAGHPPPVRGLPVLIASGIAAVVMLAGALILRGDTEGGEPGDQLNMRAVLLDTAADATAAAGVAVAGGIILWTHGLYWLDPAVALVIALIFGYHAIALVRETLPLLRREV